jgi:regulatory protein
MLKSTDKNTALKKAQNICAKQEKCTADIRQKLYEWKVDSQDHSWILEQLVKEKFIDEQRYTGYYVRDKFRFNKWGKIKIEFELKAKQISSEIIKEALESIDYENYYQTCETLLMQKLKSLHDKDYNKLKEKILRYGQSKGFEMDIVFSISEKLLNLQTKQTD